MMNSKRKTQNIKLLKRKFKFKKYLKNIINKTFINNYNNILMY